MWVWFAMSSSSVTSEGLGGLAKIRSGSHLSSTTDPVPSWIFRTVRRAVYLPFIRAFSRDLRSRAGSTVDVTAGARWDTGRVRFSGALVDVGTTDDNWAVDEQIDIKAPGRPLRPPDSRSISHLYRAMLIFLTVADQVSFHNHHRDYGSNAKPQVSLHAPANRRDDVESTLEYIERRSRKRPGRMAS